MAYVWRKSAAAKADVAMAKRGRRWQLQLAWQQRSGVSKAGSGMAIIAWPPHTIGDVAVAVASGQRNTWRGNIITPWRQQAGVASQRQRGSPAGEHGVCGNEKRQHQALTSTAYVAVTSEAAAKAAAMAKAAYGSSNWYHVASNRRRQYRYQSVITKQLTKTDGVMTANRTVA